MKSKWYELKNNAVKLRQQGISIGKIEHRLKIPRSTLSGWFKNIQLTPKQKKKLLANQKNALVKARKKAVFWHNEQKKIRLQEAENEAIKTLKNIDINNQNILEVAIAFLYLGEGSKNNLETALGSSNPLILKFFVAAIRKVYKLDINKIRCELSLRADQDPEEMKKFWAKTLKLPICNFKQINIDRRTKGSKTYPYYKGVCHLRCSNAAIQRKLIYLGNLFCHKVIDKNLGS
ncbi:MAG: hypothetical protein WC499_01310 [Patescibacteria group bacterium]